MVTHQAGYEADGDEAAAGPTLLMLSRQAKASLFGHYAGGSTPSVAFSEQALLLSRGDKIAAMANDNIFADTATQTAMSEATLTPVSAGTSNTGTLNFIDIWSGRQESNKTDPAHVDEHIKGHLLVLCMSMANNHANAGSDAAASLCGNFYSDRLDQINELLQSVGLTDANGDDVMHINFRKHWTANRGQFFR